MQSLEINRFGEMKTFAVVVELGGFSSAARQLKKSPSSISKLITRLEARLSTRLFNRSTRGLQLTEEGRIFYEQSLRVLSSLEEAEQSVSSGQTPTGHLRISTNIPIGQHFLLPIIPAFIKENTGMSLDITLTDQVIDLMTEYTDIAIRSGPMKDSSLIARKLGETSLVIVGAPDYLEQKGTPKTPNDLKQHNLLSFNFSRLQEGWPLLINAKKTIIKPKGNIQISDGESMRQLASNGAGLARLARAHVQKDIDAGRLVPVLESCNPGDVETLYAVYLGQGGYLPSRIRVFLDFLVDKINL